ncbi:MAG: hypothetical protein HQL42_05185 [Alphaproteobacteria bacterium]|nr:hypothetical protein [Alphaproteobacteria bacterium]
MMMRIVPVAALILAALSPLPVRAESAADLGRAVLNRAEEGFTAQDRREIEEWFRLGKRVLTGEDDRKGHKQKKTPPGLAKRDELPPGLAKRDTLPPGLQGRNLPGELERKLSRLPRGYKRSQVGDDIVLVEAATGVIIDILRGVGGRR